MQIKCSNKAILTASLQKILIPFSRSLLLGETRSTLVTQTPTVLVERPNVEQKKGLHTGREILSRFRK